MSKNKTKPEVTKEVEEIVYWQWIKGEKSGRVVSIKDIDDKWINFNEGGRLAKDLKDEFLQVLDKDLTQDLAPKPVIPQPTQANIPTEKTSPIRLLLDKQKKLDKIPLGLSFKVNAPKQDIMLVLENSFDLNELNQEVEKFIEDQLDTKEIIKTLKDSIKILIQERYKQI
tara:strand:- start:7 stop:516 length:510 start_codon:yes stop_codon:yes gene_type:complete